MGMKSLEAIKHLETIRIEVMGG